MGCLQFCIWEKMFLSGIFRVYISNVQCVLHKWNTFNFGASYWMANPLGMLMFLLGKRQWYSLGYWESGRSFQSSGKGFGWTEFFCGWFIPAYLAVKLFLAVKIIYFVWTRSTQSMLFRARFHWKQPIRNLILRASLHTFETLSLPKIPYLDEALGLLHGSLCLSCIGFHSCYHMYWYVVLWMCSDTDVVAIMLL